MVIAFATDKMFALCDCAFDHMVEPEMPGDCHEQRDYQADLPPGISGGPEIFHRDQILDFRGASAGHGESDGPEGESSRDEAPRQICLAEKMHRERIDTERHNEHADATIGQYGAGRDDRQHRMLDPDFLDHPVGHAGRSAACAHDLAKYRT